MTKKIYLAGGQQYSSDLGVGWRRKITESLCTLGFDVFDPSLHENPIKVQYGDDWKEKCDRNMQFRFQLGGELIDYDYNILKKCYAMLVYWDKSASLGGGTKSEITWSRQLGIPCYVVLSPEYTIEDLPIWTCGGIRNPNNVFTSFDAFLRKFENDCMLRFHDKGKVLSANIADAYNG